MGQKQRCFVLFNKRKREGECVCACERENVSDLPNTTLTLFSVWNDWKRLLNHFGKFSLHSWTNWCFLHLCIEEINIASSTDDTNWWHSLSLSKKKKKTCIYRLRAKKYYIFQFCNIHLPLTVAPFWRYRCESWCKLNPLHYKNM